MKDGYYWARPNQEKPWSRDFPPWIIVQIYTYWNTDGEEDEEFTSVAPAFMDDCEYDVEDFLDYRPIEIPNG